MPFLYRAPLVFSTLSRDCLTIDTTLFVSQVGHGLAHAPNKVLYSAVFQGQISSKKTISLLGLGLFIVFDLKFIMMCFGKKDGKIY